MIQNSIEVVDISTVKFVHNNVGRPRRIEQEGKIICGRCRKLKLPDEFHNNKHSYVHKQARCVECTRKDRKIRYMRDIGKSENDIKVLDINNQKLCRKCGKLKPLNKFYTNCDGIIYAYCIECKRLYSQNKLAKDTGRDLDEIRGYSNRIVDGQKLCLYCKEWKLVQDFYDNGFYAGSRTACRECHVWHIRMRSIIIKMEFLAAYGRVCVCCKEDRIELLTVEHIKNKGHKLIYEQTSVLIRKLKELNWPVGYETRCWGCNLSTKNGRPCEHTKEYKVYKEKLESFSTKTMLNTYNNLKHKLAVMNEKVNR